jgi:hypothetical protein
MLGWSEQEAYADETTFASHTREPDNDFPEREPSPKRRAGVTISGTRYHVGDRLWRLNAHGQQFYGTIVGVYEGNGASRPGLLVQRDDGSWPSPEAINPDDYVRTRHYPMTEGK